MPCISTNQPIVLIKTVLRYLRKQVKNSNED
jgi:hypothetical protein